MLKKIPKILSQWNQKFWPLILVGILVLSALSIPRTIKLFKNISTDPVDLLPGGNPNVLSLLKIRDKLENGAHISLVFESDDSPSTIRFLKDTAEKLKSHPLVGNVLYKKPGAEFFKEHKLLYVSLEDLQSIRDRVDRKIQKEKLKGLYVDLEEGEGDDLSFKDLEQKYQSGPAEETESEYYVSADKRIYNLIVESKPGSQGLQAASQFQDAMQAFVKTLVPQTFHPSMKIYFAGSTKVLEYRALMKDLKKVGLISGILLFIPLLIRFRNPIHVAIIFLPLAIGMPISFALSSFFIQKLNVSTSFLFALLGGLGIENGIHIFSRYYETRMRGQDLPNAIHEIFEHTGRSILTSVASVAVTFLLLTINEFRGFSEFGLISGLGLWVLFFVYFSFMPSLLILMEKMKILRFRRVIEEKESFLKIKPLWLKVALVVFLVFSLYSVFATPFLSFEYDSKKTRAEIPEVLEAKKKQRTTTHRVNNPAAVIIFSKEEDKALKEAIQEKIKSDTNTPTIDTARSYYDLVPSDQPEKMKVLHDIKNLLEDNTINLATEEAKSNRDKFLKAIQENTTVEEKNVPKELVNYFKGKNNTAGELLYINAVPTMELDDGRNAMGFFEDIGTLSTKLGTYHPSSDAIVYGIVLKTMLKDSKVVMIISILSILFFVFVDFKNAKKTGIVMLSILMGVLWLLGLMFLFKIKLNFYNMIIIPAVMGMSIDNSIHIYHRYEEMGRGSLAKVLSSTGLAAMLASLTNASGFFGLLFCVHKGLYSIGLLAVIGVGTCFLSTLVFLPAFLQFLENFGVRTKN